MTSENIKKLYAKLDAKKAKSDAKKAAEDEITNSY